MEGVPSGMMKLKIAIDAAMTALLLALMGYHLWGEMAHEFLGTGMLILFLLHHGLNIKWYGALSKGRYSPQRIFQVALDFLLCVDMLALIASGVMMSRYVFGFLNLSGGMMLARTLHLAGSYWGFVLMSMHLGMHWGAIMGIARKTSKLKMPSLLLRIVAVVITAYGLWAFIRRGFPTYLFLQSHFVFFDFSESALLFILDNLSIMGLFVAVTYYLCRAMRNHTLQRKYTERDSG